MNFFSQTTTVYRLYVLTAFFGLSGSIWMWCIGGWRSGLAFFLGACTSSGNLWFFTWLARAIEPGARSQKPWQAGAFASRYLLFFAFGYVIVNALGVSPLPVVLGLFANTASVLLSSLFDVVGSVMGPRNT